jgi:hypothetical protein
MENEGQAGNREVRSSRLQGEDEAPLTYPALPVVCRDVTSAAGVCERALVPPVKARQWSTVTVTRLVSQG